jgi:hypothetical protein
MRKKYFLIAISAILLFAVQTGIASAAKSPRPRITEAVGTSYSATGTGQYKSLRVHFQISPVTNGQIIQVKYNLRAKKYTDVKYKPPKNANKTGQVSAACSATGSAIDLKNIIDNSQSLSKKFLYYVKVQIKQPGKGWSAWSTNFSP